MKVVIITNSREKDSLMPDVKFELVKKTLAPLVVERWFIEDESCFAMLDAIEAEDIVLVETKDETTIHQIAIRGLRHTGEIPSAVMFDADKVKLRSALVGTEVRMPFLVPSADMLEEDRDYFVKPLILEDSLGIDEHSLCHTPDEVKARVEYLRKEFDKPAIIEEYIKGYDVTVGIIRFGRGYLLSAMRIDSTLDGVPFQSEKVKVEDHRAFFDMRSINGILDDVLKRLTMQTFKAIGAENYARMDYRVTENGAPFLLEVNLYPGLKDTGAMYRSFELVGMPYDKFLYTVLNTAQRKLL